MGSYDDGTNFKHNDSPSVREMNLNGPVLPIRLEPLRANGWLQDMKVSSPTASPMNNGISGTLFNPVYRAWTKKYPSALNVFDKIVACGRGKKIVLFLDYDGTLSPIVDDPDNAVMSDQMREVVRNAAVHLPTAIISGRSIDKVFDFVKLTELYYAGSHGMDIMGPVGKSSSVADHRNCTNSTNKCEEVKIFQAATEFLPVIEEIFTLLVEKTKGIHGAKVENNKFCVSVHYRNVDEKVRGEVPSTKRPLAGEQMQIINSSLLSDSIDFQDWSLVAQCTDDILKMYPSLQLCHGRKVLEVRPVIDWNKGKAVEFLLDSLGLADRDNVLPIYIGDDRTDEDAFKVLRDSKQGIGILVSSVPKESHALYSLVDPSEVMDFLEGLVIWKEQEATSR